MSRSLLTTSRIGALAGGLAARFRTARVNHARRATQRQVEDLPRHLMKDIGWPAAHDERRGR